MTVSQPDFTPVVVGYPLVDRMHALPDGLVAQSETWWAT
ncbi:hypothetical protein BN978_00180 [Mycolicibacterium mageritense DSM 44476 = CIP 104973]|nr:hypothetical protein BN978_00180 [Mycolicibacterium mageritense DSM 44476 = CIP 104973]